MTPECDCPKRRGVAPERERGNGFHRFAAYALTTIVCQIFATTLRAGEPVLRLESHEPLSQVNATAFAPDGRLFTAGFDKVVRVWKHDDRGWRPANSHRVPLGPGLTGGLNDVAVSDDGSLIAAGGNGWFPKGAGFREGGVILESDVLDLESRRGKGTIYLFERGADAPSRLTHHLGAVVALSFDGTTLASMAFESPINREVGDYSVAVWDAASKRLLASTRLEGLPSPIKAPLGFVVRRLSNELNDVAVVATFKQDTAQVWRPKRSNDWTAVKVGTLATCAVRGGGSTVSVGCFARIDQKWKPAFAILALDAEAPAVSNYRVLSLEGMPEGAIVSAASTPAQTIAFVYRTLKQPAEDWLCALGPNERNALSYRRRIGPAAAAIAPRVSIADDGRQAAVAMPVVGRFDVFDLPNPAAEPIEFSAKGPRYLHAQFVEKNGELGLRMNVGLGALGMRRKILDPATMKLIPDSNEWQAARHQSGMENQIQRVGTSALSYSGPNGLTPIHMDKATVGVYAHFRHGPQGVPLIAVALEDSNRQPELRIYRADTGEQLRRCTAHTAKIVGLEVSSDGGLLISTSLDRTVALWNVADLQESIGLTGELRGVVFEDERRVLKSDVEGVLKDDVVVGRVVDGRIQSFGAKFNVFDAARDSKPGTTLTLAFERNGQRFEVAVPIVQGRDDRKPLAQLYFGDQDQWIAWSPFGPYDSNSDSAESWIGWHFNPEGDAPVRFALGGQYRNEYRRPGLLRRLLQTRSLTAALDAWQRLDAEPPDPSIAIAISPLDPTRNDVTAVAKKEIELTLRVTNREFPLERLASLQATLDDQAIALEKTGPTEYRGRATLKKPGRHSIRMSASTLAPLARHFDDERTIHFAPPKPTLAPTADWIARTKAQRGPDGAWTLPNQEGAETRLQTGLASDSAFGELVKRVSINGETQPSLGDLADLKVPLRIGENRIVVAAEPSERIEGVEAKAEMVVIVRRTEPPRTFAPPTIVVERVEVGPDRKSVSIPASGTLTVDRAAVRIVGRVRSEEPVARFDVDGTALPSFQSAKDAEIAFEKSLVPGANRIRFSAKGASGVESRREMSLELKPRLPTAQVGVDGDANELRWTGAELKSKIVVRFDPTPDRFPIAATLKRNGETVAKLERTTDDRSAWTVDAVVGPGENRFSVEVAAAWARESSPTTAVWVRRPPRLLGATSTAVGAKPFVDLVAEVEALDGWPATEMTINGRVHHELEQVQSGPADGRGVVQWKLTARNLALVQGPNDFVIAVRNGEGDSSGATVRGLVYAPPPPPLAKVEWLSPAADETTSRSEFEVALRVESTTQLSSATLIAGADAKPVAVIPKPIDKTAGGATIYELRSRLELAPGRRSIGVQVMNGGGETRSERSVTYTPPPAVLKIVSLEATGRMHEKQEPKRTADGAASFGAVKSGRQILVGEVAFADPKSAHLDAPATIRILVNGLQQQQVELGSAEGSVRRFRAPIVLTGKNRNDLFAEVVGLPVHEGCNLNASVAACESPILKRTLHLVTIGVGEADEEKLRKEAEDAWRASVAGGAFDEFQTGYSVCGYVTEPKIREAVDNLHRRIMERSARQDVSNVVVFYFRGRDEVDKQSQVVLLTSDPSKSRSRYQATDLATRFADAPGAQLLLLDVSSASQSAEVAESPFKRPNGCLFKFDRPPNEKPILLTELGKVMPKSHKLGQLRKALAGVKLPAGASFNAFLQPPLENLVVGREGG